LVGSEVDGVTATPVSEDHSSAAGPAGLAGAGLPAVAVAGSADSVEVAEASVEAEQDRVGDLMRSKEFIGRLDHDRIVNAIRDGESRTSGEIRVYVHRGKLKSEVVEMAKQRFLRLGMEKTAARNGVLIFVAPRVHQFAVIGDEGIHRRCGDVLWQSVVEKMRNHFRSEHFSDAILEAIQELGEVLSKYFPRSAGDANELPDAVIGD
jgi:uncharacterized membrane protein